MHQRKKTHHKGNKLLINKNTRNVTVESNNFINWFDLEKRGDKRGREHNKLF